MRKLKIKNFFLNVKVAKTPQQQALGLMHKKNLAANEGMLFEHAEKKILKFWMKNTLIPLSIAFLDESGKITEIQNMMPNDENTVSSKYPCKYAVEVNQGWFKKRNIRVGDQFSGLQSKKISISIV